MNEYAIIFWLSFLVIFFSHFLLSKLNSKKINIFGYFALLLISYAIYTTVDYLAVNYGPEMIGAYASQSLIGMASGWFVSQNLRNVFRLTDHKLITSIMLVVGWYNYVF